MERRVGWVILIGCVQVVLNEPLCEWTTCHECIVDPNNCAWCAKVNFKTPRCQPANSVNATVWCPRDFQNPLSKVNVTEAKDLGDSIQLKPQKYQLDLRVGEPVSLNFSYKATDNFPVDVYFVLDVSKSTTMMRNDLITQSQNIFNTLSNLTNDVRMGIGTFGEKNLLPFSRLIDDNRTSSFQHRLNLTNNMQNFTDILKALQFEDNFDNPESGFDAIAQAIACKEHIQWRDQSRKILVHITDESYHSAGDGKFAGRMKPYDGECYLNDEGFYLMEKIMDYPSVSIINQMATSKQIILFFVSDYSDETVYSRLQLAISGSFYERYQAQAITNNLKQIYEASWSDKGIEVGGQLTLTLQELRAASFEVGLRMNKTKTLVMTNSSSRQRIEVDGQSITDKLILKVNYTSEDIEINFQPECNSDNSDMALDECLLEKGEEKQITVTINVKKFFGVKKIDIGINPKGLNEKLSLEVNVIADCDCDKTVENNSSICNNDGNLRCGICECYKDKFGPTCNCSDNTSGCAPSGVDEECSGHGNCFCGKCDCFTGYDGDHCQYRNNNCRRGFGDLLCSDHGKCQDRVCLCHPGWQGAGCECTQSKASCLINKQECSNQGWCECGECKCYEKSKWDVRSYRGDYCEQNPCNSNCHERQCRQIIPCVECLNNGNWEDCEETCGGNMTVVKQFEAEISEEFKSKWNVCSQVRVDFGCYANYSYIYNENRTMTLFVLHERDCNESQIVYGVIALIVLVLVGVATLVAWKLMTDARDRREYEQFLKAAQGMDNEEFNTTYVPPTVTYQNPAFQEDRDDTSY